MISRLLGFSRLEDEFELLLCPVVVDSECIVSLLLLVDTDWKWIDPWRFGRFACSGTWCAVGSRSEDDKSRTM